MPNNSRNSHPDGLAHPASIPPCRFSRAPPAGILRRADAAPPGGGVPPSPPADRRRIDDAVPPETLYLRLLRRTVDALIRWKTGVLLVTLVSALIAMPIASRLDLEQSIESFFAEHDPLLRAWLDSNAWFGEDEFILVAYRDDDLVEPPPADDPDAGTKVSSAKLNALRDFARELNQVPGLATQSTQSLESLLRPKFGTTIAERIVARSYARMKQEDILEFGEHIVISHDRNTTAIVLRLLPRDESPIRREETFARVRKLAAAHDPPAFVAGEPIQVNDMFRYVDQDSRVLGWASSILLCGMLLFLFRSIRWVILPLLVVHVTLVWTKALLVLSGLRLSMVSSTLTSLVTIISIATVTHITVIYREMRLTRDRVTAFRDTFMELAAPVFWTCATTSVGFLALMSSSIVPVQSFGLMLAAASMLVFVAVATILPGGVLLWRYDVDPRPTLFESRLVRFLDRLGRGVDKHPLAWLVGLGSISLVASIGLWMLQVETDFSKNFRKSSEIVQALDFFEREMGGAGSWEVNFPAPAEITDETLAPVRKVAEELRELKLDDGTGMTKVIALSDGVDFAPGLGVEQKLDRLKSIQPEFVSSLHNPKTGQMRIVLRSLEQQPAEVKLALIEKATAKARETFPEARPTGFYVLLSNLISSLLQDQTKSFILSTLGNFLCIYLAFRSFRIALLSLLPNMFPLTIVIGGMGWIGLPINIGTAMISAVSVGLTVDASIQYLAEYLKRRESGESYSEAIRATNGTVGVAMVFATLALILGFMVLALSNFIPLIYFGVLVSLAMVGGLLGSLVLLPLFLRWVPVKVLEPVAAVVPVPDVVASNIGATSNVASTPLSGPP
jgi:predicted RND superfamily exporter protein